jgi:hypothetical protein
LQRLVFILVQVNALENFGVCEVVDSAVFERFQKLSGELTVPFMLISELVLATGGQKDVRLETMIGEFGGDFPSSTSPDVFVEVFGDGVIKLDGARYKSISFAVSSSPRSGMTTIKDDTLHIMVSR